MINYIVRRLSKFSTKYKFTQFLSIFVLVSILFGLYMYFFEELTPIDTWYFMMATATTVGYGDIYPQKPLGRLIFPIYMVLGIGIVSVIITKIVDKVMEFKLRKRKGYSTMKDIVDLMIINYPSEIKIKTILKQLDVENKEMNIILLNDELEEIPLWTTDFENLNITFIKGISSEEETLERANIKNCKKALILVQDINSKLSDDFNSSTVSVIEYLNPNVYTISEKVRESEVLYSTNKCNLIIPVLNGNIIAQEIVDPGAIDLVNAIFDNNTSGTQYNTEYKDKETKWIDIAMLFMKEGLIPEGYKSPDMNNFNLLPKPDDIIKRGDIIKYRGNHRI